MKNKYIKIIKQRFNISLGNCLSKLILNPNKIPELNTDCISDILTRDTKGKVVVLTGKWGCGKTHRWDNEIKPKLKQFAYVSAFGKQSVDDIKLELLDKLIINKSWWFHLFLRITLTIITSILTIPLMGNILALYYSDKIPHLYSLSLILLGVVISLIYISIFYKPLIKFFTLKIMGVNHTNIDWKILTKNRPYVLCFDDIERLPKSNDFERILGFFEELKEIGFSVLLILNDEKFGNNTSWKEFREKVFTKHYSNPVEGVIDKVLAKYPELCKDEKDYLIKVHNNLLNAAKNISSYLAQYHSAINDLSANFRFIEKIIKAFNDVRIITKNYNNILPSSKTQLLIYIAARIMITELGINENDLLEKYEKTHKLSEKELESFRICNFTERGMKIDNDERKFHIGKLLVQSVYGGFGEVSLEIKKLLLYGKFDYQSFISRDEVMVTESEKFAYSMTDFWTQRTTDIIRYKSDLDIKITTEKIPFSTFERMQQVLQKYILACHYTKTVLDTNNSKNLLKVIKDFITNNEIPLNYLRGDSMRTVFIHTAQQDNNADFLNENFISFFKKKQLDIIKNDNDFFSNLYNSMKNDTENEKLYIYTLISNKGKQKDLFNLKNSDYKTYYEILSLFAHNYKNHLKNLDLNYINHNYKKLLTEFCNSIKSDLEKLVESSKDPKTIETYTKNNILNDLSI